MNYEDEDYVRFYTRDTVSWKALGWEGQAVLSLMLHGKFDRSGIFDCDGHDPSHAVTIVTGLPPEIVSVGLKRLLDSKVWVERDGKVVWPKFVHAQSCRRSDKARQRESREKRRSEALGQPVTDSDQPSQPVTRGHTESQPVTPSLAEPSRAEDPPTPLPAEPELQTKAKLWLRDPQTASMTAPQPESWPETKLLCTTLADTFGHKFPQFPRHGSDPRCAVAFGRWAEGFLNDRLLDAIRGAKLDENIAKNQQFQTLTTILRDAAQVDKFAALWDSRQDPGVESGTSAQQRAQSAADVEARAKAQRDLKARQRGTGAPQ